MRWRALLVAAACAALASRCGGEGCGSGRRGEKTDALAPDPECLQFLRSNEIPAATTEPMRGIRTPVRAKGRPGGIGLVSRGQREAIMDCALARALFEAAPIFRSLGVETLEFSSAYDFRLRRHTDLLSAHAHGLAIDVHVLRGPRHELDVARDFEKGLGEWRKLRPGPGALARCIGQPRTEKGAMLRKLACRLKLHTEFRVVVTPDDDSDHRDHLHLEVFPDAEVPTPAPPSAAPSTNPPPLPPPARQGGERPRKAR
jgi:hypothetical protein